MTFSKGLRAALAAASALAMSTPAAAALLTNGAGDGNVQITVSNAGAFGSVTDDAGGGPAIYDPIGATPAASTVYESLVYFRVGTTGDRIDLSRQDATVVDASATSLTSMFSNSGLDFTLVQSLSDLTSGGNPSGSLLTQTYSFTNTTGASLSFELLRYLDGDLVFNGNFDDGGGRLMMNGREILFETDTAIGSADSDTFLGIYNDGGISAGYEINSYSGLRTRIQNGEALGNIVFGDGADADQFIDAGPGYDVSLGLSRTFTLAAGATGTFTTGTLFGSGAPGEIDVPVVPEPATWAMLMVGFGMIGVAARRRQAKAFAI